MKRNLQAVIFSLSAILLIAGNVFAQVAATITVGSGGGFSYSPSTVTVNAGDSIAFVWAANSHRTVPDGGAWGAPSSTQIDQSSASTVKVKVTSTPGTYTYHCAFHGSSAPSGMYGTIVVNSGATGINNSSSTYDLSAAPNPFSDQLSLNLNVGNKNLTNLKIYDLIGKEVANIDLSGKTGQHTYRVDASHLRSGIYFCTVYSDRGIVETMKLFKTNE